MRLLVQGLMTTAIALIGLYFSWEARRSDNYRALADLAASADPDIADAALEAFDRTVEPAACRGTNVGALDQRFLDIFCPLSTHHRFILTQMIKARQSAAIEAYQADFAQIQEAPDLASPGFSRNERAVDAPDEIVAQRREAPIVERVSDLIGKINSGSRTTRRTAVAKLAQDNLSDEVVIDQLIDELSQPARLDALSAQGRYNIVYLLNQAPDKVWTPERIARTRAAIDVIFQREREGVAAIGDQTRGALYDLQSRLKKLSAA